MCHCFHLFPLYLPWSDGTRYHDLSFLILNFKPAFSLSSFTFIKRLFSSSSLSVIRVGIIHISEVVTISPPKLNSSLAYSMMCSVYKLSKKSDNKQPYKLSQSFLNPEPVNCSIQVSNICFLTRIQVSQETSNMIRYSHLLKRFPVCYNPHSQRHRQWNRGRCFSGISFLYLWSSKCW